MSAPANAPLSALIRRADVRRLLDALGEGECRFVGGVVRDALSGRPLGDIDLATRLSPQEMCARLEAAGIRWVATGLAHGSISAWVEGTRFELTRLRRDEEGDGRHARIAPVDDWDEDARRRDFTINAIYADAAGNIHDPLGGRADLCARRVRFIGAARERITEDYLRILRFFRFSASHGGEQPDAAGMAACVALQAGLARISAERIQEELRRILLLERSSEALKWMTEGGILQQCLGMRIGEDDLARHKALLRIESALGLPPDAGLGLAALLKGAVREAREAREGEKVQNIAQRLRLSRARTRRLMRALGEDLAQPPPSRAAKELLYRHGREGARDILLLSWAAGSATRTENEEKKEEEWRRSFGEIAGVAPPHFPLTGDMVMGLGISAGVAVGEILARVEKRWIAADFAGDEAWVLAQARAAISEMRAEGASGV